MNKKVVFIVGVGNGVHKPEVVPSVYMYLTDNFGGFTCGQKHGGWKNDKGLNFFEFSLEFTVFGNFGTEKFRNAAKFIREAFGQQEVLMSIENAPSFEMV